MAERERPVAKWQPTAGGVVEALGRRLPLVHYACDGLIWLVALPLVTLLRNDFSFQPISPYGLLLMSVLAVVYQAFFGTAFGLYRRRFRYGSFVEVFALASSIAATGCVLMIPALLWPTSTLPRSVPPLTTAFVITGAVAVRSAWRLYKEKQNRPVGAAPIVVIGAGAGGYSIIRSLTEDPTSPYLPVAIVDDDPLKGYLCVLGVRVQGTIDDLAAVAEKHDATVALLAVPSADSDLVRRADMISRAAGIRLLVLPSVSELFDTLSTSDIRPVTEADLLGRHPADIDPDAVAGYVTGRRVMVTGAGGSIGSELCRQLARFEPAALIMLDRDETGLHSVQLSIEGRAMLDNPNLVLADIRDVGRLDEVFAHQQPEVVFHAAALKHLTLLEASPLEAWKTNVVGTQNVLDAALRVGVQRLVNISSDKAADPCSVLGYTKRITERLTAHAARAQGAGTYVSVRFGNVLGSRGSVLPAFRFQVQAGGPITVTHPDVSRYFMTAEEAARLTIYAGAIGSSGEALVLDMGTPVRIFDVAARFAAQHHPPLEIVFTGLRPGEKLHEDLVASDEVDVRPVHPLITHVPVPPIRISEAAGLVPSLDLAAVPAPPGLW